MYFKKPGRISENSKNLEEIQKTSKKFSKNLWLPCIIVSDFVSGAALDWIYEACATQKKKLKD